MTLGIISQSSEQYRAAEGVSRSNLEWIAHPKTPAHYRAKVIDKVIPDEETDALRIGSLTHRCILEPDTMADAFYIKPDDMKFTTKDGKTWRNEHAGRPIIDAAEASAIKAMRDSVWRHPMATRLLRNSHLERSAFADDDGLLLKSRYDALPQTGNIIADLKTCESADLDSVERFIGKFGAHRQAAFYLRVAKLLGLDRSKFVFIFVEKTPPYAVALYELDPLVIEIGAKIIQRDLTLLRHCIAEDHWPGYGDGINMASLPLWMLKQAEAIAA